MSQRFKVANRDWSISNVISVTAAALASSMIQAMNSTKHYAEWCWSPQKPQTIGNDQPHWHQTWKQEGCDLPFLSLQQVQMLPSSTQALILALRLRGTALPHDIARWKQKKKKKKKLDGTKKVAEWKLLLLVQQHIKEGVLNQKWGGRQTYRMLSRQRRENSVHSTFSTNNEWKRGGGLCQWKKFGC